MKLFIACVGAIVFTSQLAIASAPSNQEFYTPRDCSGTSLDDDQEIELEFIDGALTDLFTGETYDIIDGFKLLGTQQKFYGNLRSADGIYRARPKTFFFETELDPVNSLHEGILRVIAVDSKGLEVTRFHIFCQ